jgi:hypothetical protein
MVIIYCKTGNEYFLKLKEQHTSAFTYSTVIENQNLNLYETKNIKHQPLVFFSLKLVIAGFKDYQIKYTILVLKPNK